MKTRRLLLSLVVAAGLARQAWADSSAGANSFDFLTIDANARAVGMAGAYTALANDSNALLYNPAGLAGMKSHEATFMHNDYVQGLSQEYLGFAAKQGWGLNLNYLDFGSIDRTTLSQPGGTGSTYGINDLAVGAGYARALGPDLRVGAAGKVLRESIDNVQAGGAALDLGVLYSAPQHKGLTFGGSLLNLGPDVRFSNQREKLPMMVRLGAALVFSAKKLENTLALDLTRERFDKVRMGFGVEAVYDKMMAFRLGFTNRNDADIGITAGVGWRFKALAVDYAIEPLGTLGLSNRVSMTLRWGAAAEPPQTSAAAEPPPVAPDPDSPEAHFAKAQHFIEVKYYASARAELDEAVKALSPDDQRRVRYHERMGSIFRFEGEISKAKYAYGEGMVLASKLGLSDPVVADTYTGFGLCLVAEGDTALAVKFFRKALEAGASPSTASVAREQIKALQAGQ